MPRFGAAVHNIDQIRAFATETANFMIETLQAGRDDARGIGMISALFLARGLQALEACRMLAFAGLVADATSCARTLVELDIEHAFILQTDTVNRWNSYVVFGDVSLNKIVRAVSVLHQDDGGIDPAALERMAERAKAARESIGSDRQWIVNADGNPIDLRQRAIAVGRQLQYDLLYREGCGASHGGYSTLEYVLPEGTDLPLKVLVGPDDPDGRVVELALLAALGICKAAANAQGNAQLADRVDAFGHRILDAAKQRTK